MRNRFFLLLAVAALVAIPTSAKPAYVKKAKDLGFDVKNCLHCHTDKLPTKAKKGEPFNEVGKFLNKKKADTKAAEVDLAWLKDYVAKK